MTASYRAHQQVTLGIAVAAFFSSAPGQSFLISVFVDDMLAGTGLSRTAFSGLYAGGTVVSAVSMLLLGRVIDRHGLRPAWLLVAGALALACGMASVATGAVLVFVALATLRTFGQGSFPLLGTLLVARTFERRRGQAMAVAHLGITAASIVLPPAVGALILAVGWRHAYQLIGVVLIVAVLPLALLIRTGPSRDHTAVTVEPEGGYPPATRQLGRFTVPSGGAAAMLLVLAAPPLIGTALTFHAVSILGEQGLGFLQAGLALSVLGVSSAAGTVVAGVVADRLGNRGLLISLSVLTLAAPLTLLGPGRVTAYVAFALLGIGLGATGVVNGAVWARTYGTAQLGKIQGTAQSSMITAAAMAPLIPAVSFGLTEGYDAALVAMAGFATVTLLVAARWRPTAVSSPTLRHR